MSALLELDRWGVPNCSDERAVLLAGRGEAAQHRGAGAWQVDQDAVRRAHACAQPLDGRLDVSCGRALTTIQC